MQDKIVKVRNLKGLHDQVAKMVGLEFPKKQIVKWKKSFWERKSKIFTDEYIVLFWMFDSICLRLKRDKSSNTI